MIISVIVYILINYLGMLLIYITADFFFDESEGVCVYVKLGILWFDSLFYHQIVNHGALPRPSWLLHISILSDYETETSFIKIVNYLENGQDGYASEETNPHHEHVRDEG